MSDELFFDVFTLNDKGRIARIFTELSLTSAEILYGGERDDFDAAIMHQGWAGSSPAWTQFRPVVILPHGELLRKDHFAYLMELAG
jgi:hypothetical protein